MSTSLRKEILSRGMWKAVCSPPLPNPCVDDANNSADDVRATAERKKVHNHTQQYFDLNTHERKLAFRPTRAELAALATEPTRGAQDVDPPAPTQTQDRREELLARFAAAQSCQRVRGTLLPYRVLRVPTDADDETIKRAYKRVSVRVHPDKHDAADLEYATAAMKHVNEAMDVLKPGETRNRFDAELLSAHENERADDDIYVDVFGARCFPAWTLKAHTRRRVTGGAPGCRTHTWNDRSTMRRMSSASAPLPCAAHRNGRRTTVHGSTPSHAPQPRGRAAQT